MEERVLVSDWTATIAGSVEIEQTRDQAQWLKIADA